MSDPDAPEPAERFFLPFESYTSRMGQATAAELDASLARLRENRVEQYQALRGTALLPEPQRTEERARLRPQVDLSEVAVTSLEVLKAIHTVEQAAAQNAEARATQSAAREASVLDMTDSLLTLTKWLVALATLTLAVAIVTLILSA
jgi:hypothetical protein